MSDADILTIRTASDGWLLVESEQKGAKYHVADVFIAGNTLDVSYGEATIKAWMWGIQGDTHPALLVEAPSHYGPPERGHAASERDIEFFSAYEGPVDE